MNPKIDIYCDGSCLGNPGCGGWAALLVSCYMGKIYKKLIVGSEINATNNQMELTSVIEGFKALKKISNVNIYSDSKYVIEGMKKWITVWREKKI